MNEKIPLQNVVLADPAQQKAELSRLECRICKQLVDLSDFLSCLRCEEIGCGTCIKNTLAQQQAEQRKNGIDAHKQQQRTDWNCVLRSDCHFTAAIDPQKQYVRPSGDLDIKLKRLLSLVEYRCLQSDTCKFQTQCTNDAQLQLERQREFLEHSKACPQVLQKCEECNREVPRKDLARHKLECEEQLEACEWCQYDIARKDLPMHAESCLDREECRRCGEFVSRKSHKLTHTLYCANAQEANYAALHTLESLVSECVEKLENSAYTLDEQECLALSMNLKEMVSKILELRKRELDLLSEECEKSEQDFSYKVQELKLTKENLETNNSYLEQEIQEKERQLRANGLPVSLDSVSRLPPDLQKIKVNSPDQEVGGNLSTSAFKTNISQTNPQHANQHLEVKLRKLKNEFNNLIDQKTKLQDKTLEEANKKCFQRDYWGKDFKRFRKGAIEFEEKGVYFHDPIQLKFTENCYNCAKILKNYQTLVNPIEQQLLIKKNEIDQLQQQVDDAKKQTVNISHAQAQKR